MLLKSNVLIALQLSNYTESISLRECIPYFIILLILITILFCVVLSAYGLYLFVAFLIACHIYLLFKIAVKYNIDSILTLAFLRQFYTKETKLITVYDVYEVPEAVPRRFNVRNFFNFRSLNLVEVYRGPAKVDLLKINISGFVFRIFIKATLLEGLEEPALIMHDYPRGVPYTFPLRESTGEHIICQAYIRGNPTSGFKAYTPTIFSG